MSPEQLLGKDDSFLQLVPNTTFKLEIETLAAFRSMQSAAAEDGINIDIVSAHRSFAKQQAIWDAKWRCERALYDRHQATVDCQQLSPIEKLHTILIFSALPGASRHHWGTDLDVYDTQSVAAANHQFELVTSEYESGGPCHALNEWLDQNLDQFGFFRPYLKDVGGVAAEPWHISFQKQSTVSLKSLTPALIGNAIEESEIEGKTVILDNLDIIYRQYVLNEGFL